MFIHVDKSQFAHISHEITI